MEIIKLLRQVTIVAQYSKTPDLVKLDERLHCDFKNYYDFSTYASASPLLTQVTLIIKSAADLG